MLKRPQKYQVTVKLKGVAGNQSHELYYIIPWAFQARICAYQKSSVALDWEISILMGISYFLKIQRNFIGTDEDASRRPGKSVRWL